MKKKCCACQTEKTLEEFSKHKRSRDGRQTQCRLCALEYSQRPENVQRRSEQAAKRWATGLTRNQRYQHLFGITLEDYYRMFFEQGGVCKICRRPQKEISKGRGGVVTNLCVDHNHDTGKVRGLLCNNCNTLVGMANENSEWLTNAIAYLKRYNEDEKVGHAEDVAAYLNNNKSAPDSQVTPKHNRSGDAANG